jgi:peptidoglycan/xylan/chitin deacetylase (PgdA/CDA1 family)
MCTRLSKLFLAILYAAVQSGLGLFRRPGGTFVVLMYHSVKPEERRRFEEQMDLLVRRAVPVPGDFRKLESQKDLYVAVTFDDGYRSVAENAWPVMRERKIPVTLFVVAGCVAGGAPTWISPEASARDGEERLLGLEELRGLMRDGVVIGSHSLTHPPLAEVPAEAAQKELTESRRLLERELGREVRLFAFPFGSYDERTIHLAEQAGYERVFLSDPLAGRENVRGIVAGRVAVSPGDWKLEFRLKLRGAYAWLPLAIKAKAQVRRLLEQAGIGRSRAPRVQSGKGVPFS